MGESAGVLSSVHRCRPRAMGMEPFLAKRTVTFWLVSIAALTTAVLIVRRQTGAGVGLEARPEGVRYDAGL